MNEPNSDILYIDIDTFTADASVYFARARAGEKITVISGKREIFDLHQAIKVSATDAKDHLIPTELSPDEFATILDLLDPLD